ncbi:glutaredoxin-related protein [Staphylococcus hominis]
MCQIINLKGYHGTDKSHYDNLENERIFSTKKLPSDLGNGLYLFIDRVNMVGEAIENAKKYLNRWKKDYKERIIAQIDVEFNEDNLLDLDDRENQNVFNSFVEDNEETIYNELDKLINNNTKNRGNIDGLVIEIMIREYNLEVDAIMRETYTQFDTTKKRKRSNIPNGKELCLRNNDIIKRKCIFEEYVIK